MEKILTVIVPVYNDEKNIQRCLDSVVCQTFKKCKLIIVNDASTDNTLNVLDSFREKCNLRIINMKKNSGPGACRNIGLLAADTPYVTFLDSDDWIDISTYEKCFAFINELPDIIIFGLIYDYVHNDSQEKKYIYRNSYRISGNIALGIYTHTIPNEIKISPIVNNKIYRKQFLQDKNICFPSKIRYQEDDVFTFETLATAKRVIVVSDCNYHYCQRPNSTIHKVSELSVYSFINAYAALEEYLIAHELFDTLIDAFYLKLKGSLLGVIKRIIDYAASEAERNHLLQLLLSLLMKKYDIDRLFHTFDFLKIRGFL